MNTVSTQSATTADESAPNTSPEDGQSESHFRGAGTISDPYVVEFSPLDPENPQNFASSSKWFFMLLLTLSVFAVTLTSSAYSGSANELFAQFHCSKEVFALGIALFVLGFAIGPALWAPLSEIYGRRILFIITHVAMTAFVAGGAGCQSMPALLVLRFLAGMFGASPLTNSGGVIADLFPPAKRGLAMILFCTAPFLGPVTGPILGGFVSMNAGWRWVQGVCAIFVGLVTILGSVFVPETYGPLILRRKAQSLSKASGRVYISVLELKSTNTSAAAIFRKALIRPWVLLFLEPIVFMAATYLAIIYGSTYMFLPALPIVYEQQRGWSEGVGGLAFVGLVVGMIFGLVYAIVDDIVRYQKLGKSATPESRLPPGAIGAIALPIGLFAFAWTNSPDIHWSASIILSAPFGFGCVLVFLSCLSYLLDSYTVFAASALGASAMLRAFVATAFPLFTTQMFDNLGIHWASSIPGFLTLLCLPFPFVMYKYGKMIRMKCKYSNEAATILAKMQSEAVPKLEDGTESSPV
ncbi:hypothetical protein NQ176_g479 [Zarea fungicola]|uniref:Uncharacterized protein n=1 Tax=Zarea fungicola TaxID=93591 RepID=A0ACC1NZ75_9HYPO|nr:hypothetical protein NQ176_g479 [Lecanicillium fungicola]